MRINKPWWLVIQDIHGFEDPTPSTSVTPPTGENGSQGDPAVEPPVSPPASEPGEDTSGLKSALEKERAERKNLEKELKAFRKAQEDAANAEKTEIQRLTDAHGKSTAKLDKLAAAFKSSAVEKAILAEAQKSRFTDPTDALRPEVLAAIGVEQDEDDPTQVTVDQESVKAAVKELAKNKPHYLAAPEKKTPPTSSPKFGGSGQTPSTSEEQRLAALYPALLRR